MAKIAVRTKKIPEQEMPLTFEEYWEGMKYNDSLTMKTIGHFGEERTREMALVKYTKLKDKYLKGKISPTSLEFFKASKSQTDIWTKPPFRDSKGRLLKIGDTVVSSEFGSGIVIDDLTDKIHAQGLNSYGNAEIKFVIGNGKRRNPIYTTRRVKSETLTLVETKENITASSRRRGSYFPFYREAFNLLEGLKAFFSRGQYEAIAEFLRGEEGEAYYNLLMELATRIENMPRTYDTDGQGDKAKVYLHYFLGSIDSYITELDKSGNGTEQAFGYQDLGYGGELGYISIDELVENGLELDLYWEPKTLGQVKGN